MRSDRQYPRSRAGMVVRLLLAGLGLALILVGVHNARDNQRALEIVPRPASQAERAKGIVRGLATFYPEGAQPVPPCIASWKSGKSSKSTHFSGDNRVVLEGGDSYVLSETQKIELFRNEPPARPTNGGPVAKAYLSRIKPDVKTFSSVRCLSEREPVWLEACLSGKMLVGCAAPEDPILLTVGGAGVRKTYLTSHAQGGVALVVLGLTLILFAVASSFVHARAVITALAKQRGVSGPGVLLIVYIAIGVLGTIGASFAWPTIYGPWIFGVFVGILLLSLVVLAVVRVRTLGAARRVLLDTETTGLGSATAGEGELAVRVAPDAETVEGFRAGERHAIVRFHIVEGYEFKNSSNKTSTQVRDVAKSGFPKHVPIVDGTGRGVLAVEHCQIDGPAEPEITWAEGVPNAPPWLTDAVGALPRSASHRYYTAKWVVVEPGEPLLIYGGLERVLPSTVGAPDVAAYRFDPNIPLIRGREDAPALAYLGLESALLRAIAIERSALLFSLIAAGGSLIAVWFIFS